MKNKNRFKIIDNNPINEKGLCNPNFGCVVAVITVNSLGNTTISDLRDGDLNGVLSSGSYILRADAKNTFNAFESIKDIEMSFASHCRCLRMNPYALLQCLLLPRVMEVA